MLSACNRKNVDKTVRVFSACDELAHHMLRAMLATAILVFLNLPDNTILNLDEGDKNSSTSSYSGLTTVEGVERAARSFVERHFNEPFFPTKGTSPIKEDRVLTAARQLMSHLLDYAEFREAVRYEDPERIFRIWRILIPFFLGAGSKNYAAELVNFFINVKARWSEFDAYIALNNSTVNMSGIDGKGKAIDLLQEHINASIKVPLKQSGANYSESHGTTLSLVNLYLSKCVKIFSDINEIHNSSSHSNPDAAEDIRLMIRKLQAHKVFSYNGKERDLGWKYDWNIDSGNKKLSHGWLEDFLRKQADSEDGFLEENDAQEMEEHVVHSNSDENIEDLW
jgi:hypothetical protein